MRKVMISQWNKDEMARLLCSGECSRIDVEETGPFGSIHEFQTPGGLTEQEMYCALVDFFLPFGGQTVTAYAYIGDDVPPPFEPLLQLLDLSIVIVWPFAIVQGLV
jgi:hypothetical protein